MLRFADSFDHYGGNISFITNGLWSGVAAASGGSVTLSSSVKRTGTYSMLMHRPNGSGSTVEARFPIGALSFTCGVGVGVYMPSLPSGAQKTGFQFRDTGNNPLLTICFQADGSIAARKGGVSGSIIDISDSILTSGTFNHVECKATFDTVAGYVEIRVNGVTKLQIGSLNLGSVGAATCALMIFDFLTDDVYWDDVFAWDDTGTENNDFLGAQRILTLFPAGDTAQADWTLNGAASGYDCIDDPNPDDDSTYLSTGTLNDKSDFTLPTLPPETAEIRGIFVPARAKLDAAGIGNLLVSMKSGASLSAGSNVPLTSGYSYYRNVFEIDPLTSLPWTKAGFEAALIRIEKSL